jgi:hypothetical protein
MARDTLPPPAIAQFNNMMILLRRAKGAQLAASLRFVANIDDIPRFFRLLLLPQDSKIVAKACRTLPQVQQQFQ